jgi:DNA repair protein RecO (recombination protein O)
MSMVPDRCICLRKFEYSETSQILTLFGRAHGVVRVIAKGAHRTTKAGASKFGGGIDLLDVGEAVFMVQAERDLGTLTEWNLREGHPDLRRNLRGLYLGFYAAELVSLLIEEHDPHPDLFDRLEETLLEVGTPRAEQSFIAFQMDLLRETGYLPELSRCSSCGLSQSQIATQKLQIAFAPSRGGVVCRSCEQAFPDRVPFDSRLLGVIQYVLNLPRSNGVSRRLPGLTRHQTDPINRILAEHVEHTLGRRLRLRRYVLRT